MQTLLVHVALLLALVCAVLAQSDDDRVLINKYSFSAPWQPSYYRHWDTAGSVIMTTNAIRLTPDQPGQRAQIWAKEPLHIRAWELEVSVVIGKDGSGLGADGMAVWLTKDHAQTGNMFGGKNPWEGLGIFLDTFDNDNKKDNPSIYAIFHPNEANHDPSKDANQVALGACKVDYRTKIHSQVRNGFRLRISYSGGTLSMFTDTTAMQRKPGPEWKLCFDSPISLPLGYYLGVTAETGGLSDIHDVEYFHLYDTTSGNDYQPPTRFNPARLGRAHGQRDIREQQQNPSPPPSTYQDNSGEQFEGGDIALEEQEELQQQPPPPAPPQHEPATSQPEPVLKRDIQENDEGVKQQPAGMSPEERMRLARVETTLTQTKKNVDDLSNQMRNMNEKFTALQRYMNEMDSKIATYNQNLMTNVQQRFGHEDLAKDVQILTNTVNNLQLGIAALQRSIHQTSQMTNEVKAGHEERTERLAGIVMASSSWSVWTYLVIFQIVFIVALYIWKRKQEDRNKAHFF